MQIFGMHLIQENAAHFLMEKVIFHKVCWRRHCREVFVLYKVCHICSMYLVKDFFFVNMNEEAPLILTASYIGLKHLLSQEVTFSWNFCVHLYSRQGQKCLYSLVSSIFHMVKGHKKTGCNEKCTLEKSNYHLMSKLVPNQAK